MLPKERRRAKLGFPERATWLVYGPPKVGKCVKEGTQILDPRTGLLHPIETLIASQKASIVSLGWGGIWRESCPSGYFDNGKQTTFKVRTQTGREVSVTAEHPFLTTEGWRECRELSVGDKIAVPAELPFFGEGRIDYNEIKLLAYMIGDGHMPLRHNPSFTNTDPLILEDFMQTIESLGCIGVFVSARDKAPTIRVKRKRGYRNKVLSYLEQVELRGCLADEKFIPDFVFGQKKGRIALFLNRLFACDGSVEARGIVSYSSKSARLVKQVQHLLLRFGIISILREKEVNGETYYELAIHSRDDLLRFIDEIGIFGEKDNRLRALRRRLFQLPFTREHMQTQLERHGSILLDRITDIEKEGENQVYDLTVDELHNFVANDVIVHNTTAAATWPEPLIIECEPSLEKRQARLGPGLGPIAQCVQGAERRREERGLPLEDHRARHHRCDRFMAGAGDRSQVRSDPIGRGRGLWRGLRSS